ncbi:hypothetical protein KKG48_01445 [Patescibacteria group bacterium]|nr:hypothetical protein [Patescibacteria group bacterium]
MAVICVCPKDEKILRNEGNVQVRKLALNCWQRGYLVRGAKWIASTMGNPEISLTLSSWGRHPEGGIVLYFSI